MKREIIDTAKYLAVRGMAEANAGNISVRTNLSFLSKGKPVQLPFKAEPGLKILVTRSGSIFRRINNNDVGIVEVSKEGTSFCHSFRNGNPTTEIYTHLMCHSALKSQNTNTIIHAHLANLVAISKVIDDEEDINIALYCNTEMSILIPKGIGLLPLITPGSLEIAKQTEHKAIEGKRVIIWTAHGVVVMGESLDKCVSLLEAIEKSSDIAIKVKLLRGQIK